jgi:hypothetical protein
MSKAKKEYKQVEKQKPILPGNSFLPYTLSQAAGKAGLWVEVFDPISQSFYYYDHATGSTV